MLATVIIIPAATCTLSKSLQGPVWTPHDLSELHQTVRLLKFDD